MCKRCEARGKTWNGDDPKCAFDDNGHLIKIAGSIELDNWNCATLNDLRNYIFEMMDFFETNTPELPRFKFNYTFSDDNHYVIGLYNGIMFTLSWYKNRGRTEILRIHPVLFDYYLHEEHFLNDLVEYLVEWSEHE